MLTRFTQMVARLFRPRSFVGLDIGSTTVRVTRFRRGRAGPDEIVCLQQELLGDDSTELGADAVSQRLRVLFQEHSLFGVPVVVAMPTHWVFSRILTIPFTDPKKVAQVISYETEELIPLGLDEVVFDHTIIDSHEGESTVLVAAVPQDRMTQYLELLANAGIDPVSMDLDSLALFHFYRYALKESAQDVVLIDIGASKSTICIVSGGKLRVIRSIMMAGESLTRNLAAHLGGTHAEAESEKHQFVVPEDDDGFDVSNPDLKALRDFLDPFTTEIRNTIQAHETAAGLTITQLYLCGGGAKLNGLSAYLAHRLNIQIVNSLDGRFGTAQKKGDLWDGDYASSLGLAVRPALWGHGVSINLRQGPFSIPHRERSAKQKSWMRLVVGVMLVVGIGFANFYVDYSIKETRLQTLKDTLRQDFRTTFPDITSIVDPVQQGRMALDQAKQRLSVFGHNDPATILLILADLTEHLPADRTLEVNELIVEGAKVKIEASTDSFESVDAIKAALTNSERLVEVVVSDARMGAKPGQVKFRVTSVVGAE
ncbi:MAG: hypothetical protein CMH81_02420 [Nitrospiraceae bacterium]|nr:hypothetical protein [Nitrospiraceae bacterium]